MLVSAIQSLRIGCIFLVLCMYRKFRLYIGYFKACVVQTLGLFKFLKIMIYLFYQTIHLFRFKPQVLSPLLWTIIFKALLSLCRYSSGASLRLVSVYTWNQGIPLSSSLFCGISLSILQPSGACFLGPLARMVSFLLDIQLPTLLPYGSGLGPPFRANQEKKKKKNPQRSPPLFPHTLQIIVGYCGSGCKILILLEVHSKEYVISQIFGDFI